MCAYKTSKLGTSLFWGPESTSKMDQMTREADSEKQLRPFWQWKITLPWLEVKTIPNGESQHRKYKKEFKNIHTLELKAATQAMTRK